MTALRQAFPDSDWERIDEIILGCVNQAGEDNRNGDRLQLLLSGIPASVPAVTVNRLCASGMEAVSVAARAIAAGEISLAIAGGVGKHEPVSLRHAQGDFRFRPDGRDLRHNPRLALHQSLDGENVRDRFHGPDGGKLVAAEYGIDRAAQDLFALRSHQKAAAGQKAGIFAEEIVPVKKTSRLRGRAHPAHYNPLEALAKLPAPFRAGGTVTAGNASGINDGACAVFVASRSSRIAIRADADRASGWFRVGRSRTQGDGRWPHPRDQEASGRAKNVHCGYRRCGVERNFHGAVPNGARAFGLPDDCEKVNPNGGAIALGHPWE